VFLFFMTKIGIVNSRTSQEKKIRYSHHLHRGGYSDTHADAFTQILMASDDVLYEVGILVSRWGEKRKTSVE